MKEQINIALIGNPNTGKSSLFNALTGMNQKVGNFPGVTVDKLIGFYPIDENRTARVIDLPGTYSLYPRSEDEQIALQVLGSPGNPDYPSVVVVVVDATNLKRNLLLFSQVLDLGVPCVLAINMMDQAREQHLEINIEGLAKKIGIPVLGISARNLEGITALKEAIRYQIEVQLVAESGTDIKQYAPELIDDIKLHFEIDNDYIAFELAHHYHELAHLSDDKKELLRTLGEKHNFNHNKAQAQETIARFNHINELLFDNVRRPKDPERESISNRIDKWLTHRVGGLMLFFLILFVIFQSIFTWSAYPMDLIEQAFLHLENALLGIIPPGIFQDLIVGGILPGMSGVLVFIPQIAILFLFIAVLEDTGYMARVTFMMDRIMKKFGLNGKSVVPLMSGIACAVPAIMSARTIENWKDRLITIMVTPLMSCSARLPVYTLLISIIVPSQNVLGFLNIQGLVLMGMYLLGFIAAIVSAFVMKLIIKTKERSYFIMELPTYRMPRWNNVGITIFNKVKTFITEAGKIILAVSIILWFLSSYGPADTMKNITNKYEVLTFQEPTKKAELTRMMSSEKLEASYAGHLGKFIEPVIRPLGYDWKIGIALITSFAAREVFVGTIATIYSVENEGGHLETVRDKLKTAKNPDTGQPTFTLAVSVSLMIFYAFAMQCMSTLAVVYRETKSWKWPAIQFAYMTGLAYVSAFIVFQLLK
ncbi:MAG: ferrous iron transport protein B [Sphingobacteriales bacterium]|nr:ferrous iron transport protein B [Sphingobacteriales bacterium]